MGWDGRYTNESAKAVCDGDATGDNENVSYRVLSSAVVNFREYYAAIEVVYKATGLREVHCGMTLVERRDGMLYTKDMGEDMGPYYFNCPPRILDLLTEAKTETARGWREKCRYAAARRAQTAKLKVGDKVTFRTPYAGATEWFVESVGRAVHFALRAGGMPTKLIGWKTRVVSVEGVA